MLDIPQKEYTIPAGRVIDICLPDLINKFILSRTICLVNDGTVFRSNPASSSSLFK